MSTLVSGGVRKVVLTGGPGAGKTTLCARLAAQGGGRFVHVPEAASQVYQEMGTRWDRLDDAGRRIVQRRIYQLQLRQEERYAAEHPGAMLLLDRGTVDGSAYWPAGPDDYWRTLGSSREAELARYAAVIWLETCAAVGAYDGSGSNPCRHEDDAEAIARGERLAEVWRGHPRFFQVAATRDVAEKLAAVREVLYTLGMPQPIVDAHVHAFPDNIAKGAISSLSHTGGVDAHHDGTVAGLLASMDRAGIDRAVLCSVATRPTQVQKITDWSAGVASPRLVPFASIHPDYENPEEEADRIAALGLRGIKFHPQYMNCPVDDPRTIRIARAAARSGLSMALHAGHDFAFERNELGSPRSILALHRAVPDLRLLACHMGGWQCWDEVLELLAGLPLWFETSFSLEFCEAGLLEKLLRRHPSELLLFGSDSPWADPSQQMSLFKKLPLGEAEREMALARNIHAYLGE